MKKENTNILIRRLIITIVIISFTAIIAGVITWYLMSEKAKNTRRVNNKKVLELKNQINELSKTLIIKSPQGEYESGIVLVEFKPGTSKDKILEIVALEKAAIIKEIFTNPPMYEIQVLTGKEEEVSNNLVKYPEVENTSLNYRVSTDAATDAINNNN